MSIFGTAVDAGEEEEEDRTGLYEVLWGNGGYAGNQRYVDKPFRTEHINYQPANDYI